MHEWSIAYGLLASLKDAYGTNIKYVKIKVGRLMQIDIEVFKYALDEISKMLGLEDLSYDIEIEDTRFRCQLCGFTWSWEDVVNEIERSVEDNELLKTYLEAMHLVPSTVYAYTRCPRCGSPDFEIIEGMDIKIVEVKND